MIFKKLAFDNSRNSKYFLPSNEKVCGLPDLPVHNEWDKHQEVAKSGDDDADGQADGDENGERFAEGRRPALRTARNVVRNRRSRQSQSVLKKKEGKYRRRSRFYDSHATHKFLSKKALLRYLYLWSINTA